MTFLGLFAHVNIFTRKRDIQQKKILRLYKKKRYSIEENPKAILKTFLEYIAAFKQIGVSLKLCSAIKVEEEIFQTVKLNGSERFLQISLKVLMELAKHLAEKSLLLERKS